MLKSGWYLEKIASGNLSIQAFDDNSFDPVCEIKKVIREMYGDRIREEKVQEVALMMDEYFQDIYIDGIQFNLGDEFGITCFMPYESMGNKYINEVFSYINSNRGN